MLSQVGYVGLWISFNNLCAMMMALCYLAGNKMWLQAFAVGVGVSAIMAEFHLAAAS